MRRAAETIAWQKDELRRLAEKPEDPAADDDNVDPLEQIVHALGADFHEKYPDGYDLHDVLQHIDDMHVQLVGLQDGIIQRDNVIKDYEQPVLTGSASGIEIKEFKFAEGPGPSTDDTQDPDRSVGCGDTMDRHYWIKKATDFAHKVHGATLVMPDSNIGTRQLRDLAETLIDNSPAN